MDSKKGACPTGHAPVVGEVAIPPTPPPGGASSFWQNLPVRPVRPRTAPWWPVPTPVPRPPVLLLQITSFAPVSVLWRPISALGSSESRSMVITMEPISPSCFCLLFFQLQVACLLVLCNHFSRLPVLHLAGQWLGALFLRENGKIVNFFRKSEDTYGRFVFVESCPGVFCRFWRPVEVKNSCPLDHGTMDMSSGCGFL